MPTIDGLPDKTGLLSGAERVPLSDAGTAKDIDVDSIGARAKLLAAFSLGISPERADASGTFFTTQGSGDPLTTWFPPTIVAAPGFGSAMQFTGGGTAYTRGVVAAGVDRIYEVEAEVEQVSVGAGESPAVRLGMSSMKGDFTATSGAPDVYGDVSAALAAGQIAVFRYRFAYTAPDGGLAWADPTTAVMLRPAVQVNRKADNTGNAASSVARIRRLKVTDVTAHVTALEEAVVWATSLSTAL